MSQATAEHGHGHGGGRWEGRTGAPGGWTPPMPIPKVKIDESRVRLPEGSVSLLSNGLLFAGLVGLVVTVICGFTMSRPEGSDVPTGGVAALSAYLVGALVCVTLGLGSLAYVMIFQSVNAGWSVTIRRVYETAASLMPVIALLFLPVIILSFKIPLYDWLADLLAPASEHRVDHLLEHKNAFLNPVFWVLRAILFFGAWSYLGVNLYKWSRQQDHSGDPLLTRRARWISAPGLLVFALTTAFASFDWVMSLEFSWFSTMFGVQFFAGSILSATAMATIIFALIRRTGRLEGLVTREHFHDQGKLLIAFTVFWAYITFCQYFLIWYSNIPEETLWYIHRKVGAWNTLGKLLCFGHFLAPFLVLLWLNTKKNPTLQMIIAGWIILMHIFDIVYHVKPAFYTAETLTHSNLLLDIAGIIGPVGIFLGLLVRKLASAPIIPIGDPRLYEAVTHRNPV